MNEYLIDTIEYKGYDIKLYQDTNAENPRNWDNLGTMVCFHKRYNLGDKTDLKSDMFEGWNEVKDYLIKEKGAVVIAPLFLYDHSILRVKIGDFYGLLPQGHARFDSGQIGFIYASGDDIRKEYNVKRISKQLKEKAMKVLKSEVDVYDKWGSGQVYGFQTEKDGEYIDSCWGFYDTDEAIQEAKGNIDYETEQKRQNKLAVV